MGHTEPQQLPSPPELRAGIRGLVPGPASSPVGAAAEVPRRGGRPHTRTCGLGSRKLGSLSCPVRHAARLIPGTAGLRLPAYPPPGPTDKPVTNPTFPSACQGALATAELSSVYRPQPGLPVPRRSETQKPRGPGHMSRSTCRPPLHQSPSGVFLLSLQRLPAPTHLLVWSCLYHQAPGFQSSNPSAGQGGNSVPLGAASVFLTPGRYATVVPAQTVVTPGS